MNPTYIILHHSSVSQKKNKKQFRAINNYHKSLWDFKSSLGYYVGYQYLIEPSGKVIQARRNTETGAHCYQQDMNHKSIGICLTGHFDLEQPKPKQIFALRDLLRKLCKDYVIPVKNIKTHNEFAKKSCPGSNIDIVFIRSLVTEVKPEPEPINKDKLINELFELHQKESDLIDKLKGIS